VLAAGIKAASKDPKVQAAWKTFGDRANRSFASFGGPFQGPLIRAADTFGDALERMAPTLNRMGATLAPVIDKLAPAFATMAERALPGIEKAAVASVPLFEKLAEVMPVIGSAISVFFDEIAKGAPGAATFFGHLLTAIGMTIIATGKVFGFLSQKYQELVDKGRMLPSFFSIVGAAITAAFRNSFNNVAKAWNNTIGRINFSLPGVGSFSAPRIPTFHTGGIVSGAMGAETLAVLQAGERVTPAGGGGGASRMTLEVGTGGTSVGRAMAEAFKALIQSGALVLKVDGSGVVVAG
jgi:hypothetical protein